MAGVEILPGTGRGAAAKRWWRGRERSFTHNFKRRAIDPSVTPLARHLPVPGRIYVSSPTHSFFRHPELVSGSISPPAQLARKRNGREAALLCDGSELEAQWTLKQVQGDEFCGFCA